MEVENLLKELCSTKAKVKGELFLQEELNHDLPGKTIDIEEILSTLRTMIIDGKKINTRYQTSRLTLCDLEEKCQPPKKFSIITRQELLERLLRDMPASK